MEEKKEARIKDKKIQDSKFKNLSAYRRIIAPKGRNK